MKKRNNTVLWIKFYIALITLLLTLLLIGWLGTAWVDSLYEDYGWSTDSQMEER